MFAKNNFMIVKIILSSVISYITLFIIAKLLGKKQVAQLTVVDYVVGITIGNIAGQWCLDYKEPWYLYAISMAVFLVFSLLVDFLERKIPFKKLLKGKQIELVCDAKIKYKNLKKSKLDVNDLLGLCRAKGFFDLEQVSYVFLENNGEISVLPKSDFMPASKIDVGVKSKTSSSPAKYLIIDGSVDKTVLSMLGRDRDWLFKTCGISNKKQLKNIILAEYIDENNVSIHKKDQNCE